MAFRFTVIAFGPEAAIKFMSAQAADIIAPAKATHPASRRSPVMPQPALRPNDQ